MRDSLVKCYAEVHLSPMNSRDDAKYAVKPFTKKGLKFALSTVRMEHSADMTVL